MNIDIGYTNKPLLSEQNYRSLIENLREVVFQLDAEGNFVDLNPAWERVTGYSQRDALGQSLYSFVYAEERGHVKAHLLLLLDGRVQECRIQARYLTRSNRVKWMDLYACAVHASNGSIVITGAFADITEHKVWEQRISIERAVTKVLAESTSVGAVIPQLLKAICQSLDWDYGELWMPTASDEQPQCVESWCRSLNSDAAGKNMMTKSFANGVPPFELGANMIDSIWASDGLAWLSHPDSADNHQSPLRSKSHQTAISMPILDGHERLGVMLFFKWADKPFNEPLLKRLRGIGGQIGEFMMRVKAEKLLRQKHVRLQSELQEAAAYVSALLPSPMRDGVEIVHQFVPSNQLGGDAFDYYWLDDQHFALYLLDVSGHGVRSTLLSVGVLNLLRNQSLLNADFYQPQSVLQALNRVYQMDEMGKDYFTIWYGVYNQVTRTLSYATAGHPPGFLCVPDAGVQKLSSRGHAIGLIPGVSYQQNHCEIAPNSQLYLFSDGVYEIVTRSGEQWQLDHFFNLIADYHQQQKYDINHIFKKIASIQGSRTFLDDYSLIQAGFPQ